MNSEDLRSNNPPRLATVRSFLHRREKTILLASLLLGAVFRLAYWAEIRREPDYRAPVLDALYHDYWARAILTGNWQPPEGQADPEIPQHPYVRPPLYPYVLFGVYALAGVDYDAPRVFQFLLGLFSAWLAGRIARRLFGVEAGLFATLVVCGYWSFPYYEAQLVEPSVVIPLMLGWIACMSRWATRSSLPNLFFGGLLLGLLVLGRPNALLLVPVGIAWVLWAGHRAAYGNIRIAKGVLLFLFAAVLGILPAIWRNYVVSRELVPVTAVGGQNLYLAYNEKADGYTGIAPDISKWSSFDHARLVRELGAAEGRTLTYGEASAIWRERALKFIRENPARSAALTLRKFLLMWGPLEVSVDREDELERQNSALLHWSPVSFSVLFAAALVGVFLLVEAWPSLSPDLRSRLWFICAVLLVYAFSYLPFTITGRYRVPILPVLVLPAAYAASALFDMALKKRMRAVVAWLAAGLVLWVVVSRNYTGYEPSPARYNLAKGLAYGRAGRADAALPWLREAVRLKPDFAEARLNYGVALSRIDHPHEAAAEIEKAVKQEPDAFAWQMLGRIRRQTGDRAGAESAYREALHLSERDPSLWNDLGILLGEMGRLDEALAAFERACAEQPSYFDARVNLGRARLQQGHRDEAAREFDAALRLNPRAGAVAYDLAKLRGLQGRYEEAVALLYQALDSGPPQPEWLGALAWIRAAHPRDTLRNGAEADQLAQMLVRLLGEREPTALVVAAAAAAEAGRIEEARDLIDRALRLLPPDADPELVKNMRAQQAQYQAGAAYRDASMLSDLTTK